jgi:hypothetical protein
MTNPPAHINLSYNRDDQQVQDTAGQRFSFKVEQSKIPEFFAQKCKDTITAMVYIRRIDNLVATNNNFANVLRGKAREWLLAFIKMARYKPEY